MYTNAMRACGWLPIYMNPEAVYNERLVIGVCCYTAERAEKKSRNSPTSFAWVLLSVRAKNSNIQHLVRTALWVASKASRNSYGKRKESMPPWRLIT